MCFGSKKKSSRRAYTEAGFKTEDNLLPISNVHYKHPSPGLSSTRMGSHPIFKGWPRGRVGGSTRPLPPARSAPNAGGGILAILGTLWPFPRHEAPIFLPSKLTPKIGSPGPPPPGGGVPWGSPYPVEGGFVEDGTPFTGPWCALRVHKGPVEGTCTFTCQCCTSLQLRSTSTITQFMFSFI